MTDPVASIVVPAHNEARGIARLLTGLLAGPDPAEFEIVVVCNGCSDDTAEVVRRLAPTVTVVEVERPSKHWALIEGDRHCAVFPRLYVDADIELGAADARALAEALATPGIHAVAPERHLVLDRSSRLVRAYYRVWDQLPVVRTGLFGRGVIGVDLEGHQRLAGRPEVLGDDLYVHSRFADAERKIVGRAQSRVRGPLTISDLLRRRSRAAEGNAQLDDTGAAPASTSRTGRDLAELARSQPQLLPSIVVFLTVTALSRFDHRRRGRAGRGGVWLRDESSRS